MTEKRAATSPLDEYQTSESIEMSLASVDAANGDVRVAGYSLVDDLAQHYSYADVLFLTLVGELPSARQRDTFDACLVAACALPVSTLAMHAAWLGRISAARGGALAGLTAVALAEEARTCAHKFELLFRWLTTPDGEFPEICLEGSAESPAALRLLERLNPDVVRTIPVRLRKRIGLSIAIAICLHSVGISDPERWQLLLGHAPLPLLWTEASTLRPAGLRSYPLGALRFEYEEEQ